jgi:WD40 repeat protein
MSLARVKVGLVLLLAAGMTAAGSGMLAHPARAGRQPAAQQDAGAKDTVAEPAKARGQKQVRTDRYGDPLPDGVLARLGTLRLRAAGAPMGLSPDGKTIITVTRDRQVKLWDADTGKLRGQRKLSVQPTSGALLTPDGRILVAWETDPETPIDIWDVTAGKRIRQEPSVAYPQIRALSPDGKMLAVSQPDIGFDLIHELWDIGSGDKRVLKSDKGRLGSVAFSPDGKLYAAASGASVICWRAAKGEQLWRAKVVVWGSLAFTPDGRTLIASPGFRERSWHAWDAVTGSPAEGLKLPEGYPNAEPVVAPDGRTLVFAPGPPFEGADGRIRLWDLRSGKLLRTLPVEGRIGPFTPDGRSFLTNDGTLQRWELATGRPLLPDTYGLGHRGAVDRVVYSPDGRRLASAAGDGTIRLWEVATSKPLHVLRSHDRGSPALAFSPDGKLLVSGGEAGELHVWDAEAGREVRRISLLDPQLGEKKQNVQRLHAMLDGRTILVLGYVPARGGAGLPEGILTRWDLATGRRQAHTGIGPCDGSAGVFSSDGRVLASPGLLLDTTTGKERVKLEGPAKAFGDHAFSREGKLVAGVFTRRDPDGVGLHSTPAPLPIWDAGSGRMVRRLQVEGGWTFSDGVGHPAFSPDGRYLAAAVRDGIRLWELATGEVVMRHKAHEPVDDLYSSSFVSCLAFAPDGRTLATGNPDSSILIWDLVPPVLTAAAGDLNRLWDDLAAPDPAKRYAASWQLTDAPDHSLLVLRERLHPAAPAPAEQVRPLLDDLDNDDFRRREAASARLRELGERAEGALRKALLADPSLEKRRRLGVLLKAREGPPSAESLRELRAAAVLERIGTAEAVALLKELAGGDPAARLTREAAAVLERSAKR